MIDIILVFTLSFLITYFSIPRAISSLTQKGLTVPDHYKENKPEIPTQGAVVILFSVFLVTAFFPLFIRVLDRSFQTLVWHDLDSLDLAVLLVIATFALYGLFDDMIEIGWWSKLFLPLCFSFPLLIVFNPNSITFPIFGIFEINSLGLGAVEKWGINSTDFFKVIIIPVYVMVVANLVNMHSGFNGLQSGLSILLLGTLILKSIMDGKDENLISSSAFLGGIIAFLLFNRYPSRIIEGNIGSLTFGAAIGILIIIKEYYIFGIFILLPHIMDFLLWLYDLIIMKRPFLKFGELRDDGTIKVPTPMKMKFLFPYYYRLGEKQVVLLMYILTGFFCISGLILF